MNRFLFYTTLENWKEGESGMAARFDPTEYGESFEGLLKGEGMDDLGPGTPHPECFEELQCLNEKRAFAGTPVKDPHMAQACLAGIWLYHNYLTESHHVSQSLSTSEGSYWHGIMHRREPDYSNAKYWFRQVKNHPVFPRLHADVQELLSLLPHSAPANTLLSQAQWDPFAFVDLCEKCFHSGSYDEALCLRIQRREWELLFDYCYTRAI
jgi:hypothetical protein